jgi:hypothetical protein
MILSKFSKPYGPFQLWSTITWIHELMTMISYHRFASLDAATLDKKFAPVHIKHLKAVVPCGSIFFSDNEGRFPFRSIPRQQSSLDKFSPMPINLTIFLQVSTTTWALMMLHWTNPLSSCTCTQGWMKPGTHGESEGQPASFDFGNASCRRLLPLWMIVGYLKVLLWNLPLFSLRVSLLSSNLPRQNNFLLMAAIAAKVVAPPCVQFIPEWTIVATRNVAIFFFEHLCIVMFSPSS